ncbi:MAG: flavodoxin family protein [Candidatus Cloacimonetes bacterium]|nr:flavodoxin family protein [Candidatus Cloacimonadota bacterium]MBS3768311.1 flavodoxin family protein [Candidatus Cloacimonadota bacterium]
MKIVVIFGSPRKKNSYLVTKQFETEMKKLADFEFEYIFLKQADIKQCIGCHNCLFYGEEKCPFPDVRENILQKLLTADGLIFVSPVYVAQVTAIMKNFIDRLSFLCHRPALFDQDVMVISTTGVMNLKDVLKYLKDVAYIWGAKTVTTFGLVTPPDKSETEIKQDIKIKEAVEIFYKNLNTKNLTPALSQVIQFKAQRTFLGSELTKEVSPKDYEHYSKLQNKSYYVPAKINFFKRTCGWLVEQFVKLNLKKEKKKLEAKISNDQ